MMRWSTGEIPDGTVDTLFLASGTYTVGFGEMRTSRQVRVTNGDVTFDGGGFGHSSAVAVNQFPQTALQIGGAANTTTRTTFLNGTFGYDSIRIGSDSSHFFPPLEGVDATLIFGAGAMLNAQFVYLHSWTNATLIFEDGAQATFTGNGLTTPELAGQMQTVRIRGEGTTVDFGSRLEIAEGGSGHVEITDSADVTVNTVTMGLLDGSDAHLIIDDAALHASEISTSYQQTDANATMEIRNGGTVTTSSTFSRWGNAGSGMAMATIQGEGSEWDHHAGSVGHNAHGRVEVSDGGRYLAFAANDGLGIMSDGRGELIATGDGTELQISQIPNFAYHVGKEGEGLLQVLGGARMLHSGAFVVGLGESGSGEILVSGAGSMSSDLSNSDVFWNVGDGGQGVVRVEEGARMDLKNVILGNSATGDGSLRGSGAGTHIEIETYASDTSGLMRIGVGGQGLYELSGGATGVSNEITLGEELGSQGDMLLTGAGTEHTVRTGDVRVGQMGEATLTITDGARLRILNGSLFVGRMGEILGDGSIESGVVIDGSISPDSDGSGPLRIGGDYGQTSDGRLEIEILGDPMSGLFGALDVMGEAMLAGTLVVQLDSAFTPSPGHSYEIISAASIVGEFEDVLLEVPADASRGDTPGDLRVSVTYGDGSVSIAVIPAPATGLAAALGLCLAGGRRRA